MFKPTLCAALALAALSLAPLAQAARPFVTDDAGVLEAKSCELELVALRLRFAGAPSLRQDAVQAACGWGLSSQLGVALLRSRFLGESDRVTVLYGKTSVVDGGENKPSLVWTYNAEWARLSAGGSKRVSASALSLVASVPMGKTGVIHANLGHKRLQEPRRGTTTWAVAWEVPVSTAFDVGIERFGDDRVNDSWWGLGLRWTISPRFSLNASAAKESVSNGASVGSVGLRFAF
jgi:hypothetical protein